eukprot:scaffold9441_cov167-Amphora_coffeaeformis.AAC.5
MNDTTTTSEQQQQDKEDEHVSVVNKKVEVDTQAPSHWTADGHAVVLPGPTRLARRHWVERAIVQHGLLKSWIKGGAEEDENEEVVDDTATAASSASNKQKEPKIHPLALASARLQNDGINELNRGINLTELVKQGEYFGLTNIVADAALELAAVGNKQPNKEEQQQPAQDTAETPSAAAPAAPAAPSLKDDNNDAIQQYQSLYILKRKHLQFQQAASVVKRHRTRLQQALQAEAKPLQRLAALRHRWRLTAPEHGQRARAHAIRATEVLAADVDVTAASAAGRLARRIPRYATIELRQTPIAKNNNNNQQQRAVKQEEASTAASNDKEDVNDDAMDIDEKPSASGNDTEKIIEGQEGTTEDKDLCWTYAEPFALADPTLGKLDADFDPSKIEMLTLQFSLEDSVSCVSACLEPTRSLSETAAEPDELVLMELQHSLLCAKLFESMRRELADDTEEVGQIRTTSQQLFQNVVWLAATPAVAATPLQATGRAYRRALQVVHVHEGQVCVQLDGRYTLSVQLVPSSTATDNTTNNTQMDDPASKELLLLCKTLLWHAHTLYHEHFVLQQAADDKAAEQQQQQQQGDSKPAASKAITTSSPHILQGCVHLGTKMLTERKIRMCFHELQSLYPSLQITCLSTSLLASAAHWTLQVGEWQVDAELEGGPRISICWWDKEDFRKVDFESVGIFRLFLQRQLRRVARQQEEEQQQQSCTSTSNGHAPLEALASQTAQAGS